MIRKVVLTGGPGSGKTTVIESIKKNYGGKYKVIIVDETASYLINMGIRPFGENSIPLIDLQELVLKTQLSKEEVIDKSLEFLPDEDILIIYDRGIMDNAAYISEEEFKEVIERVKTKETIQDLKETYGRAIKLYDTQIPLAVKTAESTSRGKSIFKYDKNSKVATAYEDFAKEVLEDDRQRQKNGITKDFAR